MTKAMVAALFGLSTGLCPVVVARASQEVTPPPVEADATAAKAPAAEVPTTGATPAEAPAAEALRPTVLYGAAYYHEEL